MFCRNPASVIGPLGPKSSRSFARHLHVVALPVDLVRLRHVRVKGIERELHHAGMRHPGAIVAVGRFAFLVRAHFGERLLVRRRIVLYRDLRRHSAHREGAAAMTRLDAQAANRSA